MRYRLTQIQDRSDTRRFLDLLEHDPGAGRALDPKADIWVARAPGRLDVMGGIADYSGSLVLQLPIREAAHAAVQRCAGGTISVVSLPTSTGDSARTFEIDAGEVAALARDDGYDAARERFGRSEADRWAGYVVGAFVVLARALGLDVGGARVLVASDVPEGKGVSSSAALEVAVASALCAAYAAAPGGRELALLCQTVENRIVGAPCGVMDQMTAACGRQDTLLALLCQPAELEGTVDIPTDVAFWGLDSGVRHAVTGEDYGSVRTGAFMGYRMIAEEAGLRVEPLEAGRVRIDDPGWHGYLANLSVGEFEERFEAMLPAHMKGHEFLDRYHGTTDPVTEVRTDASYPVRAATAHPVRERARIDEFRRLLGCATTDDSLERLGRLMYASHESYSACGLGSDRTDLLVELVRRTGPSEGLYGAKITGGGSGGTVAVLGRRDAADAIGDVVERYERETGFRPHVFDASSPGAEAFGTVKVERRSER